MDWFSWLFWGVSVVGTGLLVAVLTRDRRRVRADEMRRNEEWAAAYRAASRGLDPPPWLGPPSSLALSSAPPAPPTNTMAVLALVFGVLGGLLAIPFGHVALSQIRRTGEGGRGAAIVGLVLGYLLLAGLVVVLVALAVTATATG